jgi:hypothetical protein
MYFLLTVNVFPGVEEQIKFEMILFQNFTHYRTIVVYISLVVHSSCFFHEIAAQIETEIEKTNIRSIT